MSAENQTLTQPETAEKKAWVAPELTSFGEVSTITKGTEAGFLDLFIGTDGGFETSIS